MNKFEWNNRYNIGVDEIDKQHQYLLEIFNELIENRKSMKLEDLGTLLCKLIKYSEIHFEDEEALMLAVDYPNYSDHKKEHLFFIKKLENLKLELKMENAYMSFDILIFLSNWLINHILTSDKDLAPYLYGDQL